MFEKDLTWKDRNIEKNNMKFTMDFWASLEHKLKYKKDVGNAEEIAEQLKVCADSIELWIIKCRRYEIRLIGQRDDESEKD